MVTIKKPFNKGYFAIAIIIFLFGMLLGYALGVSWAFNWGAEKAVWFFSMKGINIELDKKELAEALLRYHIQIDGAENDFVKNETLLKPIN